jgi:hypothetical protein
MPSRKERIDKLPVERGLAETRERAQALILAGAVVNAGTSPRRRPLISGRMEGTSPGSKARGGV